MDKSGKKMSNNQNTPLRDPNVILQERISRFKKAFEAQSQKQRRNNQR